jgi:pimeloyl-ACP methyl ester carboxylesterase
MRDPRSTAMLTALNVLAAVVPGRARRVVYDQFCTPPPVAMRTDAERRALETLSANTARAAAATIAAPDGDVMTYRWPLEAGGGPGGAAPRVLLVHGWGADARVMTLFVEPLRRAGFEAVALDLPAHGQSSGTRLNMPIGARAVRAVFEALGPFQGIIAHSFGGLATTHALEGGPPLDRGMRTDKLVLLATPHSLDRLVADFARGRGYTPRLAAGLADAVTEAARRPVTSISTGGMLRVADVATLVIQDRDDDIVPAADGDAIVAAAPRASLHSTSGLGHSRIIVTPAIVRGAIRFIKGDMV